MKTRNKNEAVAHWESSVMAVLVARLEDGWPIGCSRQPAITQTSPPRYNLERLFSPILGEPDGWMAWEEKTRSDLDAILAKRPPNVPKRVINVLEAEIRKSLEHPLVRAIRHLYDQDFIEQERQRVANIRARYEQRRQDQKPQRP